MSSLDQLGTLAGYCMDASREICRDEMADGYTPLAARLLMILLTWSVGIVVAIKILRGDIDESEKSMPIP